MKQKQGQLWVIGALAFWNAVSQAGLPMPPAVTYGLIRDEYGQPLLAGAQVWLVKVDQPDTICAGHAITGLMRADVNYRLSLELENAAPLVRPYAALVGDPMQVLVKVGEVAQPLTPTPVFNAPGPGSARRVDFFTGTDSDGDGLPDAWEWLIVAWAEGLYETLQDIRPDDDLDGDNMSNHQEFLAGTNPLLSTDLLVITRFESVPSSTRMAITFTTVENRTYYLLTSSPADAKRWSPVPTGKSVADSPAYQTFNGSGRDITVYIDGTLPAALYRVAVN